MINEIDAEALVTGYKFFERTCKAIDGFIYNFATNFGSEETEEIADKITDLIERKNKLINLKLVIDECVKKLPINLREIIILKMKYVCSVESMASILNVTKRTVFRKIKKAMSALAYEINKMEYSKKIVEIIYKECWLERIKGQVIRRRHIEEVV